MTTKKSERIGFFDALRGFTMISMALFHGSYDLAYIYDKPMPWFTQGPFQDIWRASISWVFLFIAGWMCSFSHDNIRRGIKYAVAALVVWLATTVASVDDSVNFGIIFCMAASTLIVALAMPLLSKCPPLPTMIIALAIFGLTWNIPHQVYEVDHLAWLGFPGAGFVSGDYYPLVPFFFMYLAGFMASRLMRKSRKSYPAWMYAHPVRPLEALGRHALPFYLLHQPIILAILELAYSVR